MPTARNVALSTALTLCAAFAAAPHAAFALGSTPVTVVNPSVTVDGTVNVGNPTDLAKAQNALRHPFLSSANCLFGNTELCQSAPATNPNGQQSIDFISGICDFSPGVFSPIQLIVVEAAVQGNTNGFVIIPIADHTGVVHTVQEITFGQPVHLLVDAGDAVSFSAVVTATSGAGSNCVFTFSGEKIDQ